MSVDSIPCFELRARELNVDQHLPLLRAKGWTSFGTFAFASDYIPGVGDPSTFTTDVIIPLFGDADHVDKVSLRRLFFESFSLVARDMQRRVEGMDSDKPRAVPNPERNSRRERAQARLKGLKLEGELEPSHFLQDLCFELWDTNSVRYVPWESCSKRDAEMDGIKTLRAWKPDVNGIVREQETQEPQQADLKSDLLLSYALRRRGIALEMADVCSFETHEALIELLLSSLLRPAPGGYSKITIEQLHRADREVWRYLALSCRGGIRRGADGLRPLDSAIPLALLDPTVRMFLHPLPSSGSAPKSGQIQENTAGSGQKRRADNLAAENKRLRAELAAASQGGGGKGGGKQKGKKQKGRGTSADQFRPKMPAGLIGKSYRTSDGNPICFSFNLPCGCSGAQPGGTCSKGAHVCAEPGCSAKHSLTQHA